MTAKKFVAEPFVVPTVDQMDAANDGIRVELLILRCLATSDMAFQYMLYSPSTLTEICSVAKLSLAELDRHIAEDLPGNPGLAREFLSEDERKEYYEIIAQIEGYAKECAEIEDLCAEYDDDLIADEEDDNPELPENPYNNSATNMPTSN